MRKDRIAEWLLDRVTTHERAASTVGDLRETAVTRGGAWFWWSVMRTAASLLWRGMVADPREMLGLAFRAWLVSLGLAAVVSFAGLFVAGMVFGAMAMRHSTGGLGAVSGGFGDVEMMPAATASMMLCQFVVGRWIARRAPRPRARCLPGVHDIAVDPGVGSGARAHAGGPYHGLGPEPKPVVPVDQPVLFPGSPVRPPARQQLSGCRRR